MTGRIELEVQLLDDPDRMEHTFRSEGLPAEAVPMLLLGVVQAIVRQQVRQEMDEANPLGNAEMMDATAALEARLMLMDMVVHLPVVEDQQGIITAIE
jgi:hypothetical protein